MIVRVAFADGRAHFSNRYVRTAGYVREEAAGRILLKNVFATLRPGGPLANAFDFSFKNVANTGVLLWGGRLLALWEAAPPHRLDPHSLGTLGLDELDGLLAGGQAFSAHPRFDPASGAWFNFGVQTGLITEVHLYRLSADGRARTERVIRLPGFAFLHDFALSQRYWIFFQNPLTLDPLPFVLGLKAAGECLKLAPSQPTNIVLVPRDGGEPITLKTDPFFVFHHVNAFEEGDRLVVDSIRYERYLSTQPDRDFRETDFQLLPPGQLWRTEIDLVSRAVRCRALSLRPSEFPQVHPSVSGRPHRYVWLASVHDAQVNAPLQAIAKVDLTTEATTTVASFAPQGFVGEPLFVPRPGATAEDDGWLLVSVYDAERHRSDLVVLDAATLERRARLGLRHHLPYGLHGTFTEQVFWPR